MSTKTTAQLIGSGIAIEFVVAFATVEHVVLAPAEQLVVARAAKDGVGSGLPEQLVGAASTDHAVVPSSA